MTQLDRAKALYAKAGFSRNAEMRSGIPPWFARATGVNRSTVQRWGDDDWPSWAQMILALLEALPVEDWPLIWRNQNHDAP